MKISVHIDEDVLLEKEVKFWEDFYDAIDIPIKNKSMYDFDSLVMFYRTKEIDYETRIVNIDDEKEVHNTGNTQERARILKLKDKYNKLSKDLYLKFLIEAQPISDEDQSRAEPRQ